MALSANTVLEVRTTGADTNGGGFVTGASGTDWSLQNGAQYAVADGVTAGTTTITSATANFGTDVVGNIMYVQGGTGSVTAGWYQITVRNSATSVTVDRSTGLTAGTGVTLNIGGAFLSPGIAASIMTVQGMLCYVKSGTYSFTSASSNVAAGVIANTAASCAWIGYNTNRTFGNTDTQPVFQTNVSTATQIQSSSLFTNITFDGNSQTSSKLTSTGCNLVYCTIKNFNTASSSGTPGMAYACTVTANSATTLFASAFYCEAYSNTATPFSGGQSDCLAYCLSYSNSGASTDGFAPTSMATHLNCIAVGNGRNGFTGATFQMNCINCHAQGNAGQGYTSTRMIFLWGCSGYNNSGGNYTVSGTTVMVFSFNAITAGDPFVDSTNSNFALNNLTGRGASMRSAAYASLTANQFPRGLTRTFQDVGAAQSRVPWRALAWNGGISG